MFSKNEGAYDDERALAAADARRRPIAPVELVATIALALSTVIAVTAVTIGIARADALNIHTDGDSSTLAIALLIGMLLSAMGGLTAIMANDSRRKT